MQTTIRVHVERTRGGLARRISGSTDTEQDGCARGKQQSSFDGKLAVAN